MDGAALGTTAVNHVHENFTTSTVGGTAHCRCTNFVSKWNDHSPTCVLIHTFSFYFLAIFKSLNSDITFPSFGSSFSCFLHALFAKKRSIEFMFLLKSMNSRIPSKKNQVDIWWRTRSCVWTFVYWTSKAPTLSDFVAETVTVSFGGLQLYHWPAAAVQQGSGEVPNKN